MPLQTAFGALIFALGASLIAAADAPPVPGKALYNQFQCAGCHEYAEVPGFEVVVLHDLGARYDAAALAALLAAPPPGMPLFGMDEAQRNALAEYLRERFP